MKISHKESILKSIIWRLLGVLVLALVTFAFTGSLIVTTLITFLHHFVFIFVYYLHERLWIKIGDRITGRKRAILRTFFYEIILGHGILGLITWLLTGNWTQVTLITIVYIENKLWIYVLYDWLWDKVKRIKNKELRK